MYTCIIRLGIEEGVTKMDEFNSGAAAELNAGYRRDFLKKAVKVGVVAPTVATFSMSGLMARPALAQSNLS